MLVNSTLAVRDTAGGRKDRYRVIGNVIHNLSIARYRGAQQSGAAVKVDRGDSAVSSGALDVGDVDLVDLDRVVGSSQLEAGNLIAAAVSG